MMLEGSCLVGVSSTFMGTMVLPTAVDGALTSSSPAASWGSSPVDVTATGCVGSSGWFFACRPPDH